MRLADSIHERQAHSVDDARQTQRLLAAMNAKYGIDASFGGPIWFFRLDPPGGAR